MTPRYQFHSASSVAEAVRLAASGAAVHAGGTELAPSIADRLVTPDAVVDIGRLGLDRIEGDDHRLRIGATATMAAVAGHPTVNREVPALAEAIRQAASEAIRQRGTIGGNLLQGPRCAHWRLGPKAEGGAPRCELHRPGGGCAVREKGGDGRRAAVASGPGCPAVHPSDLAVALLHADATLEIVGPDGERGVPLADLFAGGPSIPPLAAGELIRAVEVPRSLHARSARFGKVRDRASFDFALVSAVVSGTAGDRRIVLGGVAWGPRRCPVAEPLVPAGADWRTVRRALTAELAQAGGVAEARYKIELAARLVASLLPEAAHSGPAEGPAEAGSPPNEAPHQDGLLGPGAKLPRHDAVDKVTGRVRYLADLSAPDALEGVFVLATIPAGRVAGLDLGAAKAVAGVVRIIGPGDLPHIEPITHWAAGQSRVLLMDDVVRHEGQPVALVLATTPAAAREAAGLVEVRYQATDARTDFAAFEAEAQAIDDWVASDTAVGDVERGVSEGAAVVEGHYTTADRHHAALEPAGVIARYRGERLEVETSTQWVYGVRAAIGAALGMPLTAIRVRTPAVGGGFGAKGSAWGHEILAALLARELGRPVRIVLPRAHTFTLHGYQPATRQRVTVAAGPEGRLTAIRHESLSAAAIDEDYLEHGSLGSRTLYRCPNIATRDRLVRLHRPQPTFMRAPHEGPGITALEIAMDELAVRLEIDPVELRLVNDATADPTSGRPFSSRRLAECLTIGAERFQWRRRTPEPGSMRAGEVRIGWGMASALMATFRFAASARITLRRDGRVVVESAAHEIGTGAGTTLAIVASEALGVDPGRIEVRLGDTDLPEAGGTFGSATTLSVGSAVRVAAERLKAKLEDLAGEPGLEAREYPDLLALRRLDQVEAEGSWAPERNQPLAMNAYGAVFVEVRVDPARPVPRVARALGVYSAGRIVNPVGARGQAVSGMIWGLGQGLLEDSRYDPGTGRFLARGLGGYQVATHADVGAFEAHFVAEHDSAASLLGARGVGEIGTIGIGAAIANAVYHATGVRVRDLPIRVEALLGAAF
ncbi:MAG: hypothetical protein FJ206_12630 [Gemmatimonadetes bacterium]|nr:hypothetical protein [Gemmatimonadota bacterium]